MQRNWVLGIITAIVGCGILTRLFYPDAQPQAYFLPIICIVPYAIMLWSGSRIRRIPKEDRPKPTFKERLTLRNLYAVTAAVAYGIITRLLFQSQEFQSVTIGFLCGVPFVMGFLVVFMGTDDQAKLDSAIPSALGMGTLFLVLLMLLNIELAICLVFAAPLYYGIAILGAMAGHWIKRWRGRDRVLPATIGLLLLLPYIAAPLESRIEPPIMTRTVDSQVTIYAAPEKIWENIIRVPEISADEQSTSFFQFIGIPKPIEAKLEGEGVGTVRRGIFEDGLRFNELITAWEPNQRIQFEIKVDHSLTESAALYQIGGQYLDIQHAEYQIEVVGENEVTLHLSGTYQLATTFNPYAALWADLVMRDFQDYVLGIVKQRAES